MRDIFIAVIFGLLWIMNLVNGTGLDEVYNFIGKVRILVLILACLKLFLSVRRGNRLIKRRDFFAFAGMATLFTISSFINEFGIESFKYLWVFLVVYLLSDFSLNNRVLLYISIGYCVGGLFILYVYNYKTILSGWNENSIAMVGMHSFLVFLISFFESKSIKDKIIVAAVTVVCAKMLDVTNSRSGMLFLIVGMLFAINILPRRIVYQNKQRITTFLLVPLIVSVIVVLISRTGYFFRLEAWSYLEFGKPIFNGRNEYWLMGFQSVAKNPIFGVGSASTWNWHNSAIACLAGYGIPAFCFWISSFKQIFNRALWYSEDSYIQGCIVSFMVLYVQQSVELGFISSSPSILPYVILGIMLGRIKYLRKVKLYEEN